MPDLDELYVDLLRAADRSEFDATLLACPLGDQFVSRHPLGFHVVKLERPPHALRLHLWKPGGVDQKGYEIHDHVFSLKSRVIEGAIRHRTYETRPDALGPYVAYAVEYKGGESRLARTDNRLRVSTKTDDVFGEGDDYAVAAGQLHDAEIASGHFATTLVLTTHEGGVARSLGPWDGHPTLTASRSGLSSTPLRELGLSAARAL
jgi:hypothetical protein